MKIQEDSSTETDSDYPRLSPSSEAKGLHNYLEESISILDSERKCVEGCFARSGLSMTIGKERGQNDKGGFGFQVGNIIGRKAIEWRKHDQPNQTR